MIRLRKYSDEVSLQWILLQKSRHPGRGSEALELAAGFCKICAGFS
jgi:hypothetical protein